MLLPRVHAAGDHRPLSRQPVAIRNRASPSAHVIALLSERPTTGPRPLGESKTPDPSHASAARFLPPVSTTDVVPQRLVSSDALLLGDTVSSEQFGEGDLYALMQHRAAMAGGVHGSRPGTSPPPGGAGYAAFEQACDRVLRRRRDVSIDETWRNLAAWVDKFYVDHDSSTFASAAARAIDELPPMDSPKATVRVNAACMLLHDAFSILGHQFQAMTPVLNWIADELLSWLFVNSSEIVERRESAEAMGPHHHELDWSRLPLYGGKTYRHVLRATASRLPETAAVEYGEKIKSSLMTMVANRNASIAGKYVGICFRLWRRQAQLSRTRAAQRGGGSRGDDPLMYPNQSSASFNPIEDRTALVELRNVTRDRDTLFEEVQKADAINAQLRQQVEALTKKLRDIPTAPPLSEATKVAVREAAYLRTRVQEVEASLQAALSVELTPPVGLNVQPRDTATDIAIAFLTQHSKTSPVDFTSVDQLVFCYAYALHARCSAVVTASRLHAIIFPDSLPIRKLQLQRLCETHFAVPASLLDEALTGGVADKHVPVVTRLIVGCQRRSRRPAKAETLDLAIRQQLEYASLLEAILLRHPYADHSFGDGSARHNNPSPSVDNAMSMSRTTDPW